MKIKLNGMPWDDVQVPAIPDNSFHTFGQLFRDGVEVAWSTNSTYAQVGEVQDKLNYWYMSHTPVTEEFYKMSVWSVDGAVDAITKLIGW